MAAGFRILAQHRTVQVLSPTQVQDVVELTARATPSGITFVRTIPYSTWAAGGVKAALMPIAEHIEQVREHHAVVGGNPVQRVDGSGLLRNEVEFVITTPTHRGDAIPTHTATVRIPVQALHDETDFRHYFTPVEQALANAAGA